MKNDSKALRNIVLISQLSICVMVPTFLCLALGIWLDKKFGTWFTIPLLFILSNGYRNFDKFAVVFSKVSIKASSSEWCGF